MRTPSLLSARAQRDAILMPTIERVWSDNLQVYGVDKVWMQMNREGVAVARCTVERLMRQLGLQGVRRGKVVRTTVGDLKALLSTPVEISSPSLEMNQQQAYWLFCCAQASSQSPIWRQKESIAQIQDYACGQAGFPNELNRVAAIVLQLSLSPNRCWQLAYIELKMASSLGQE